MKGTGSGIFRWRFGESVFDEARWELRVRGQAQALEPRPLEVLCLLLRRPGAVVSKQEFHESVWAGSIPGDKALTNAIAKLRRAVDDADQSVIETVHKIGYRFIAPVRREQIPQPALIQPYPAKARPPGDPHES